jgi:hypothetical protein
MSSDNNNDDPSMTPVKPLRGFAANPQFINKGGRPKGSRNKSTLVRAQLQLDSSTEKAAEFLEAVMENNVVKLGMKKDEVIPMSIRLQAADKILNKAIANEKDKPDVVESKKKEEKPKTKFSPRAVKK